MSVATEITRIQNAKVSIKSSIENKGVSVPSSALIDTYSTFIDAISGGGGLEYETGDYTPTEDISRPTINFSRTHSEAPLVVAMFDTTGTTDQTTNTNYFFIFFDEFKMWGMGIPYSSTSIRYAVALFSYRGTSTTSTTISNVQCSQKSSSSTSSGNNYPRYWVDESSFRPYTNSSGRMWRPTRTYKWIAIWKP
jgi:hypothetical protein